MSDQLLGALKICLLILLYLFFARVLWPVWSEVRSAKVQATDSRAGVHAGHLGHAAPPAEGTEPTGRPAYQPPTRNPREKRAVRPARGTVTRLVVIEPRSMKGVTYPLGDEITLGRGEGCTISLSADAYLSGLHARVFRKVAQAFVEDLGSTNGSFLNGTRLSSAMALSRGDRLQIGNTVLEAD